MKPPDTYRQVIDITQYYLGPATERFVSRLISHHFHKQPEELTAGDLPKLAEWIKVSLGSLTENRALVDDCEEKILSLSKKS